MRRKEMLEMSEITKKMEEGDIDGIFNDEYELPVELGYVESN